MDMCESESRAEILNCPMVSDPSSDLPLTCNSSSVTDFTQLNKLTCRLCAFEENERVYINDGDGTCNDASAKGWIVLSKRWFQATETVDSILKKYLPEGLMASLPIKSSQSYICPSCVSSIQVLKEFCDHILKGQEKLSKLFQSISSNLATANVEPPKKRGRPRKDTTAKNFVSGVSQCANNIVEREKRNSRPPRRYGAEICTDDDPQIEKGPKNDAKNISLVTGKEMNDSSQNKQIGVALSEDVLIADFSVEINTDLQLNILSNTGEVTSSKSDELLEISQLDTQLVRDDNPVGNEDEVETENSTKNDPTFKLEERYVSKRKKRGRPKQRKRKYFKCDLCDKVYTAYPSLVYHKLSHHENRQDFQCTECGKQFAHKALLANHMFVHSSVRSFICEETNCNRSFKTRASLYNHVRIVHDLKRETFTCETCGLGLSSKWSLQSHKKIHTTTGTKPYTCDYCDKGFRHKGNFKEHVRSHTKEKPYKCDIMGCGRSFVASSQLRAHKMRHSENKVFLCSECGMSFCQNVSLIIHLRSHKGEILECSICQKQFKDTSALKIHQRVHSGEAPFQCDVCNKVFKDPSNFSKHKKKHTKLQNTDCIEKDVSTSFKNPTNSDSGPSICISTEGVTTGMSCRSVETNVSENDMVIADAPENFSVDTGQMSESLVQILSQDELAALGGGTSADDGNIVFLYQPDDLFSISVEETPPLADVPISMDDGETVVLQEVIGIEDLNALTFETQE